MTMKLFLDDLRNPPDPTWTVARTAEEAITHLKTGLVVAVSLDHDLGPDGPLTGYDVACYIEQAAKEGALPLIPHLQVHSANPVGRARMTVALVNAGMAWARTNKKDIV